MSHCRSNPEPCRAQRPYPFWSSGTDLAYLVVRVPPPGSPFFLTLTSALLRIHSRNPSSHHGLQRRLGTRLTPSRCHHRPPLGKLAIIAGSSRQHGVVADRGGDSNLQRRAVPLLSLLHLSHFQDVGDLVCLPRSRLPLCNGQKSSLTRLLQVPSGFFLGCCCWFSWWISIASELAGLVTVLGFWEGSVEKSRRLAGSPSARSSSSSSSTFMPSRATLPKPRWPPP